MSVPLDRDLLDAFVPEFEAEAVRLAMVRDVPAASRALDQLRAMAGALGAASLSSLVDRAAAALDPLDWPALHAGAEALAHQARAIGAAGADLPLAEPDPALPVAPDAEPEAMLDREILDAFAPEFTAGCAGLATAANPVAARRAVESLRTMAASLGIASLGAMLEGQPPEPFDVALLPGLAAALAAQAEAIHAAGHDLAPPAAPGAPPQASARKRVLVVDDSAMMRRLVRETLALDASFEVVGEAADGVQALAAMAALAPDLTMLDIEMPELDGIGVMRRWAMQGGGAVVIVSSAARPGSAVAVMARRLGASGIVGKPSGALSPDLRQRQGAVLLRTARRAAGLPVEGPGMIDSAGAPA